MLLGHRQYPEMGVTTTKDGYGSNRGNPRWWQSCPKMEVSTFHDGVVRAGYVMGLYGMFGDAALWCGVLWWAVISIPCPVSPGADYQVEGTMATVAVSQVGVSLGSPALIDGEPARGRVHTGMGKVWHTATGS